MSEPPLVLQCAVKIAVEWSQARPVLTCSTDERTSVRAHYIYMWSSDYRADCPGSLACTIVHPQSCCSVFALRWLGSKCRRRQTEVSCCMDLDRVGTASPPVISVNRIQHAACSARVCDTTSWIYSIELLPYVKVVAPPASYVDPIGV
jgi:hypothetical protein